MTAPVKVLLATRNAKKLNELQRILGESVTVLGMADVPEFREEPETGATFEENATDKAAQAARETGLICLADDSGLAVDALNGMPGVLSARWSGVHGNDEANIDLLLAQLNDVPDERRGAGFVCTLALVGPDGLNQVVRGEWRGSLLRERRGSNGFGYDPIFLPEDADGRSSAELSAQEKDALSHRGRAIRLILPSLRAALGLTGAAAGTDAVQS